MAIYGIQCKEDWFPGMWQRWFRAQCVAVGWPLEKLEGPTTSSSWNRCRKQISRIRPGDWVVVQLKNYRIGRIGEVIRIAVSDEEWDPLVQRRPKKLPLGEMGRRIHVRWDLENAPHDVDTVIQLPENVRPPVRSTINPIYAITLEEFQNICSNKNNWVGLSKRFRWENQLSDYIAAYPYRLEEGMLPFPDAKIREKMFPDGSRLDVLLEDQHGVPVVVECKQNPPSKEAIKQLFQYMKHIEKEVERKPRGIVCFGGSTRVAATVKDFAKELGNIEFIHYDLFVNFST